MAYQGWLPIDPAPQFLIVSPDPKENPMSDPTATPFVPEGFKPGDRLRLPSEGVVMTPGPLCPAGKLQVRVQAENGEYRTHYFRPQHVTKVPHTASTAPLGSVWRSVGGTPVVRYIKTAPNTWVRMGSRTAPIFANARIDEIAREDS